MLTDMYQKRKSEIQLPNSARNSENMMRLWKTKQFLAVLCLSLCFLITYLLQTIQTTMLHDVYRALSVFKMHSRIIKYDAFVY